MGADGRIDLGLTDANAGGCACGGHEAGTHGGHRAAEEAGAPAGTEVILVEGMTCGHCVSAVTEELSALAGVEGVDVDLHAGGASRVTVRATATLDDTAVDAAVAEAGYRVVR